VRSETISPSATDREQIESTTHGDEGHAPRLISSGRILRPVDARSEGLFAEVSDHEQIDATVFADGDRVARLISSGCRQSTHLGRECSQMHFLRLRMTLLLRFNASKSQFLLERYSWRWKDDGVKFRREFLWTEVGLGAVDATGGRSGACLQGGRQNLVEKAVSVSALSKLTQQPSTEKKDRLLHDFQLSLGDGSGALRESN